MVGITGLTLRHRHSPSLSAYEMRSISERWMDEAPDHARPVQSLVPCLVAKSGCAPEPLVWDRVDRAAMLSLA